MKAKAYSTSARTQIARLRHDLDELFKRAEKLDEADELTGDIYRYICIRVSGFLEQSLAHCARSLCSQSSWGPTQRFALSWMNRTPNPRAEEILKFVQRFDDAWEAELRLVLDEDEHAQSINALLGIRNDIAHGKNQGVSRGRTLDYYAIADKVVDFLLEKFEPLK